MFEIKREHVYKFIVIIFVILFIYIIIAILGKCREEFVAVPGNIDLNTCLATCAIDSQCQTSLYDSSSKQCDVSKVLENPSGTQVAYTKSNMQSDPHTFIASNTQQSINTDSLGVTGQGLPIDWTQDTDTEAPLSQAETDAAVSQLQSSYAQPLDQGSQSFNPPSNSTPPYTPGTAGAAQESPRSRGLNDNNTYNSPTSATSATTPAKSTSGTARTTRTTSARSSGSRSLGSRSSGSRSSGSKSGGRERMTNIPMPHDFHILDYATTETNYVSNEKINKQMPLNECLQLCKNKKNCGTVFYDMNTSMCTIPSN
jgi:hypothetical protein